MLSTRRLIVALALALPLAGAASAQAPVLFTIDAPASQFTFGGTSSVGPVVGNPNTFGLSGTLGVRTTSGTTQAIGTLRFAPGGDALVSPDLNAEIPNPVIFLPPLATINIANLRLELTSNETPVGVTGTFTTNVVAHVLSGIATVTPITGSPSVTDLTGTASTPQVLVGSVSQSGVLLNVTGPLQISFILVDPGTGITATIDIMGTIVADYAGPAPTNYCTAATNSSGAAAGMSTTGTTSLFAADLGLQADALPQSSLGYFIFSADQGFVPGFGNGQGNLCLGGGIFRLSNFVLNSGATGQVALPLPYGALPPAASLDPGESWNFQYWFRDSVGGSATSNTTDGIEVTFVP